MEFIDTHTHLFTEEFNEDRAAVIHRAVQARVKTMLLPNIDLESIAVLKETASVYNENCFAMMGLHPCSVKEDYNIVLESIRSELDSDYPYKAIGEIGIDLYWDATTAEWQKHAFSIQCNWAAERGLAVSVHTRNASYETIKCVKALKSKPKGVFHCFTGSFEEGSEMLRTGFKLGIGGVLTYKNSNLPAVLKHFKPEDLVLETDSPYLPPVPYRGKRNESSYIPLIAERLAEVFDTSVQTIADITTANAREVFGL